MYRPGTYQRDGLNTLVYSLNSYEERLLYTRIAITLPPKAPPRLSVSPSKQTATTPPTSTATSSKLSSIESAANNSSARIPQDVPDVNSKGARLIVSESNVTSTVSKNYSLTLS